MVEQEIKEKLGRSASNGRRRCPTGTPGDARDAPTEHFRQEDKNKYCYNSIFYNHMLIFFVSRLLAACYAFLVMLQAGSSKKTQIISPTNATGNI